MDKNQIIESTAKITASFEGCKLTSYRDAVGVWTIGYGTTYINNIPVKANYKITQQEALNLLTNDLGILYDQIYSYFPNLTEGQMMALLDFCYNLGFGAFKNSTLFSLLSENKIDAASNQFERWNKAGNKVLPGLVRRRAEEKKLFDGDV